MTTTEDDVRHDLIRRLNFLTGVVIACLLLSVGVAVFAYISTDNQSDDLAVQTERTTTALCTFRADIESRVTQTQKFLAEHPEGFAGIPAAQLRQSLDGQLRTVRSLRTLDCP